MDWESRKESLTREQKASFVLLLVFAFLIVVLGVLQIRNNIYNPFAISLEGANPQEMSILVNEEARLQSIDTDQDGLNDYEELNFYNTSAYLPDTDSDGLTDKEEVDKGSDPLCPKGEICAIAEAEPEVEESPEEIITLPAQEQLKSGGLMGASGLGDLTDLASVEELLKDPALIREALIASGEISQEELNQIDDETLVALIEQIIAEEESGNLNSQ
ncbi:MAG TPA: thrombospondin type 3 repeat-containing protein [Patescibacteria group bacterium]|nr:thrombospondin type 3 repeat-containing protein [Patescibacteria group bacterium]